jgi:hypothetical protein
MATREEYIARLHEFVAEHAAEYGIVRMGIFGYKKILSMYDEPLALEKEGVWNASYRRRLKVGIGHRPCAGGAHH